MRQEACISDIEKLKDWFFLSQTKEESRPYFTVYRGAEPKNDRIIYRNTEIGETDKAWEILEDILEMHSEYGGIFRIFITNKPGHNWGLTTMYRVGSPIATQNQQGIAGMYGMYSNPRDLVAQEIARERKIWELEQQIKDLRTEQEAKVGKMDNMIQEFMPIMKDLAHKFGMKMMGFTPTDSMPMPAPNIAGHQETDTLPEYDYERIDPALDELRQVIPDVETNLEKLARWARQNPELAKQMLNNL